MAVGPILGADGTTPPTGRQGHTGESIVGMAHGKYFEAASRGLLFGACSQAGVAPGTALGTTAAFALYNPPTSGKRLSVCKVSLGYVSGTLGAGVMFHCVNVMVAGTALPAAPSSGTALTVYSRGVGLPPSAASNAATASAMTGATVTQPIAMRPFCSFNAILASTATGIFFVSEDVNGEFVIYPGYCYQLQSIAASGSTPLVAIGATWEEVPLV